VVVVGSSNFDLIAYVHDLPKPGETLEGYNFKNVFGGKGANQAVMAALLGAKVAFVGKVGVDTYGSQMKQNFIDHNIDIQHLSTATNTSSGLALIFVSSTGENCIVIVPGANNLVTPQEVKGASQIIQQAKVLLVQLEIPLDSTTEALQIAKKSNVTTILNTAPAKHSLPDEIYNFVDILCANQTELEILTGQQVHNITEATMASKTLLGKGVKHVLVTLGEQGSLLVDKEKSTHVPADIPADPVIDTTGAGDCYLGSFAYFFASGESIESSMCKASYIAGVSVSRLGTQTSYPTKDQLPQKLFE